MGDFRNEVEPTVDRFKDTTGEQRTDPSTQFVELEGFEPTTLQTEKESGGWLRTTIPEGVPLGQIHDIYTAGSRGAENRLTDETVNRNRTKRVMDGTQGGEFGGADDSSDGGGDGGDGGDDGG